MKIISLSTSYPRNASDDAGIFVHRLNKHLLKHLPITVCIPKSEDAQVGELDGVSIHAFTPPWSRKWRSVYGAGLVENIKSNPFLILELPFLIFGFVIAARKIGIKGSILHANWILAGFAGWILKIFTGMQFFLTLRGSDVRIMRLVIARVLSLPVLKAASKVICVSEALRAEMINLFPSLSAKFVVIHNGVDSVESFSLADSKDPAKSLIAIGSVIERKNTIQLVRVLAELSDTSVILKVVGSLDDHRYVEQVRMEIDRLKLSSRVLLYGVVAPDKIFSELQGASLFVSASKYEGRPNAVLEAISVGVPVVLSPIPPHLELVEDGVNGASADFEDPKSAARLIDSLLTDPELRARAKAYGAKVSKMFSWENCASQYIREFNIVQ